MIRKLTLVLLALTLLAAACTSNTAPSPTPAPPKSNGTIYFYAEEKLWRVEARAGAVPENLTAQLDALAAGLDDTSPRPSPDGQWVVFDSERFDQSCVGWSCVTLVRRDLREPELIKLPDDFLRGYDALPLNTGNTVLYVDYSDQHDADVWIVNRAGASWKAPLNLTLASPYLDNTWPSLSPDGKSIVFQCGDEPYPDKATSLCKVNLDGSSFEVVWSYDKKPAAALLDTTALSSPSFAPDGSIVFEAYWRDKEEIWRLPPGGEPRPVSDRFENDNSPCVLPDGRIVSLWLNSPEGDGTHQLKVMNPDGSGEIMLTSPARSPFKEVDDYGISCAP